MDRHDSTKALTSSTPDAACATHQAAVTAEAAVDCAVGYRPPGEREVDIAGWSLGTAQEGSKKPESVGE